MTLEQLKEKYLNQKINSNFAEELSSALEIPQENIKYNEITEEYKAEISGDTYYTFRTKTEKDVRFLKTTVISVEEKHLVPPLGLSKL